MKEVKIISEETNTAPKFIKTKLVTCERDGEEFKWECVESHDSVHILVDNYETNELIYVKQVRIPVLVRDDSKQGQVIEACAGIVDKDLPLEKIAIEEVEEELGYSPKPENISFIKTLRTSVGSAGAKSHLFLAQVSEADKISNGGGLPEEDIEVVRIKYEDLEEELFFNDEIDTDAVTLFLTSYLVLIRASQN